MSGTGSEKKSWKKPFGRSSTKEHKDKEKSTKHGSHKERSGSGSKGASGYGQKKSGHDDFPVPATFPAHVNPITITSTSTAAGNTKPKVEAPGVTKRADPPSDKDLKFAIHSLVGDPQERRDSKGDVEYYREQYRMLKSENESLRDKIDDLGEEVESAKTRVRVKNETIAKYNDAVNEKDRELSKLQKSLQKAQSDQEGTSEQLTALQKRYTSLSQDKDKVVAEKVTLDQSYKAKVADLERRLSDTTKELSHFNKQLQKAQDDDVPSNIMEEKITKLEENLKANKVVLLEETNKVKKRDEQVANMTATNKHLITELNRVKQTMEEIENSKQTLEAECQQLKAHNVKGDKEKIVQLENTVVKQTVEYAKEVEKIKKEMTSALQEREFEIERMKTKLLKAENEQQSLQEANDEKKGKVQELEKTIHDQATKEEAMKAAIRESQSKHQEKLIRENKEKDDLKKQLQELQNKNNTLNQQIKDKEQETKSELNKLTKETKLNIKQLKEQQKVEIEEAVKEATTSKENLYQEQQQLQFEKDKQIKDLQKQLKEKTGQITELGKEAKISKSNEPTGQLKQLLKDKETMEQQMKVGYKEREDRIAELEEFINDQVAELDRMEGALKQTVASNEIAKKELNEALEKEREELAALKVACEKKDEEIHNLDQSLSQMSVNKEEMDQISVKLTETEEKLAQVNRELQAYKEKEHSMPASKDVDGGVSVKKLTKENSDLNKKCLELKKEKESLTKRCEEFKKSCNTLKDMLQKSSGKELQVELAKKCMEIDKLNQQIAELEKENEAIQSSDAKALSKPIHGTDQEFHSSVEYQPQELSDQSAKLSQMVKQLELELESTKSAAEAERQEFQEKIKELEAGMLQRSMTQSLSGEVSEESSQHGQDNVGQLEKECEGHKQTQKQLHVSYQKLSNLYRQKEEEVSKLTTRCNELQAVIDKQNNEMCKIKQDLENVSGFMQTQHEKLVLAERDRDTAITQNESEQKAAIELNANLVEMRSNYTILASQIKSKDAQMTKLIADKDSLEKRLTQDLDSKEVEIAELITEKKDLESKLAQMCAPVVTTAPATSNDNVVSNKETELLQGYSESTLPSPSSSALAIPTSEKLPMLLKEKDQTIAKLQGEIKLLQAQQMKSSEDTGVGDPCPEHIQSGGVGDSADEGNNVIGASNSKKNLLQELADEKQANTELRQAKAELEQANAELEQGKKELEDILTKEREATAQAQEMFNAYETTVQQLRSEKCEIEKQMKHTEAQIQDGYKEREDRIAELEEFINDQVAELDKMEVAMKQTVANKQILEKDYQKLHEHYNLAKKTVEQYESRFIAQEEKISRLEFDGRRSNENANSKIKSLEQEKEALIQSNKNVSREVARLMNVDQELQSQEQKIEQYKLELRKAEEELQTKEFMLKTWKEDFEQERKDRENAHNIKEDEIRKINIKMANFEAECNEKVHNIQQAHEAKVISFREHANRFQKENEKLKKESELFKQECTKLRDELDKERKDAQGKSALYKKKTEQFQLQWKKREEAEAQIQSLTEELNAQSKLNKQLNSTIDSLLRKSKGIEPQIPPNTITNQQLQSQQQQASHHPHFINVSAPMNTQSDQYHTSITTSRPQYDTSVGHTNAEMEYHQQPPPSSTSQPAWQRQQEHQRQEHQRQQEHQQQLYLLQQQQQEQLHLRGQGRGSSYNQPVKPLQEGTQYPPDYQGKKYIPPANHQHRSMQLANIDNHQLRSIQPEYNIAGTNASPLQGKLPTDDYNYYAGSSGPASLDSSLIKSRPAGGHTNHPPPDQSPLTASRRTEKPTQYASEAINEEIRYQADRQRRHQEYERFDSNLQLDPYLICPKCKLQFREGQLPEYRHHIDNCHH